MTKKNDKENMSALQVNTEKAMSKDNNSIEELTYEEQQFVKEYQNRMFEEELYRMEVAH